MNNPAASGGVSNSSFLSMLLTPQGAGNLTLEKIKVNVDQNPYNLLRKDAGTKLWIDALFYLG